MLSLLMAPNLPSKATSFSSVPVAWITTLSPTFRSFRAAGDPLFWNFVAALTVIVTVFFAEVSTVTVSSEMLVTVPITCFPFPWANAIAESASAKANTATFRFIVLLLRDLAATFWDLLAVLTIQGLVLFLLLLFLAWPFRVERFHLALLRRA